MAKPKDEDSLIRSFQQRLGSKPGRRLALGVGDDAALFSPGRGHQTILTCDWFLEGTHFSRELHPPDSVGWKCLARAISDVAAMGGTPKCFLLSLALPESHTGKWLNKFLGGLRRAATQLQCSLAGGDTTKRKDILINITVIGEVRTGRSIVRSNARVDDLLYVSGRLGQAELGLGILRGSKRLARPRDPVLQRHLYPVPRVALGRWLANSNLATSMMDLSDGLSSDLTRLCLASRAGAIVAAEKLPLALPGSSPRSNEIDLQQLALHGGEDYELLFTVARANTRRIPRSFQGVPLTPIGKITRKRTVRLLDDNGREQKLLPAGWDPFRR